MKFLIVPAELKPKELLVYAWLYKHSNQTKEDYKGLKKNEVYASSRKISDETEVPQSSVAKILTKLEKESYITQVYKSKSSKEASKYFLNFSESVFESHSESVSESVNESVGESVQSIENIGLKEGQKTVDESVSESVGESHVESVAESISNNTSSNVSINKSSNISKDNIVHQDADVKPKKKTKKQVSEEILKQMEEIWNLYPRKQGKQDAFKKIPELIETFKYEQIKRCTERYAQQVKREKTILKYIKHGSTFFNGGYVDYLDENYKEVANAGTTRKDNGRKQEETEGDKLAKRALTEFKGDLECTELNF